MGLSLAGMKLDERSDENEDKAAHLECIYLT